MDVTCISLCSLGVHVCLYTADRYNCLCRYIWVCRSVYLPFFVVVEKLILYIHSVYIYILYIYSVKNVDAAAS